MNSGNMHGINTPGSGVRPPFFGSNQTNYSDSGRPQQKQHADFHQSHSNMVRPPLPHYHRQSAPGPQLQWTNPQGHLNTMEMQHPHVQQHSDFARPPPPHAPSGSNIMRAPPSHSRNQMDPVQPPPSHLLNQLHQVRPPPSHLPNQMNPVRPPHSHLHNQMHPVRPPPSHLLNETDPTRPPFSHFQNPAGMVRPPPPHFQNQVDTLHLPPQNYQNQAHQMQPSASPLQNQLNVTRPSQPPQFQPHTDTFPPQSTLLPPSNIKKLSNTAQPTLQQFGENSTNPHFQFATPYAPQKSSLSFPVPPTFRPFGPYSAFSENVLTHMQKSQDMGCGPGSLQRPFIVPPPTLVPPVVAVHNLPGGNSLQTVSGSAPALLLNDDAASDSTKQGAMKLESWLLTKGKTKKLQPKRLTQQKQHKEMWQTINHLSGMVRLISSLSADLKNMAGKVSTIDNDAWDVSTASMQESKNKYNELESLLDESSVKFVEDKLVTVRKKRARLRKARATRFEEKQKELEARAERSLKIDKWQEEHRAKIKEENIRISRKAAADRTLAKVTREIQDASRLIETMLALQKLRLIRRDASQKRGETDLGESRNSFEQKITDMTRLVQSQLDCYREEEAKLKLILRSEQEENTEKERLQQMEVKKLKQKEEDEELQAMLFGADDYSCDLDLLPYVQYYNQAQGNLEAFVRIRQEWDCFLVPEHSPASTAIPSSWVLPEPPSSSTWASALR